MAHHQTSSSNLIAQLRDLYPYEDTKQSIDILPYVPVHDPLIQQDKRLHREEILKYQNRDAHLLLCCTNNKLWTLVFHDPSVNIFLETYLMYVFVYIFLISDYSQQFYPIIGMLNDLLI
jgi:hypothetical protein